jgi:hypothetical protein
MICLNIFIKKKKVMKIKVYKNQKDQSNIYYLEFLIILIIQMKKKKILQLDLVMFMELMSLGKNLLK